MFRYLGLATALAWAFAADGQDAPRYETDVRPIFQKQCGGCHFPEAGRLKGKLDLSTLATTLAGGSSGATIVAGDVSKSDFIGMLEHTVEPYMPPPEKFAKLDSAQIDVIKAWIAAGTPGSDAVPQPLEQTDAAPAEVRLDSAIGAVAYAPHADPPLLARGRLYGVELVNIDSATGMETPVATLPGHAEMVRALAFTPDGSILAAAGGLPGRSGEIILWDVAAKKPIRTINGHTDNVLAAVFSPDGKRLATSSYDKTIVLWDVETGEPALRLVDHVDAVFALAFSPDGERLASGAGDRTVKIWNPHTGDMMLTISDSTDSVYAVAFAPDGKRLAGAGGDKMIRMWDVSGGDEVFKQSEATGGTLLKSTFAHEGPVLSLVFSPDGATLYSTAEDKRIKAWDSTTLTETTSFEEQSDWVTALALSPDGKLLAAGRYDTTAGLYDATTGTSLGALASNTMEGGRKKVTSLAVEAVLITATVPPSLQSVSPDRWARGGHVELTLKGKNLDDAEVMFADKAITISDIEIIAGEKPNLKQGDTQGTGANLRDDSQPFTIKLKADLPADLAPGNKEIFVRAKTGLTNSVNLNVIAEADLPESEPNNDSPQALPWPKVLVGAINEAGDVDRYNVTVQAGDELVFVLSDTGLNPVMRLFDPTGNEVRTNKDMNLQRNDILGYTFDQAGEWTLEIGDAELRGNLGYRLHVGAFPLVTAMWPLGLRSGTTTEVHAQGYNLESPTLAVTAPENASSDTMIPLPIPAIAGNPVPAPRIAAAPYEEITEEGDNDAAQSAPSVPTPLTINGRIDHAGDADCYRFRAKEGEEILLEVLASRAGSPLDSEIDVLSLDGAVIQRAVVRCVAQTKMTLSNRDSKQGGLRVETWRDMAMDDYLMVGSEILQIEKIPDYGDEDVVMRTYPNGQRMGMFATTPEHHAVDTPIYKVEIHPAGSTFPPNGMPLFPLYWRNDDGFFGDGESSGDSFLRFTAPADGEYIVRIRDTRGQGGDDYGYRLMLRTAKPNFDVVAGAYRMNVSPGGRVSFEVRVRRKDGFDGPVAIAVHDLPDGFSVAPATIEPGEDSVRLALTATESAQSTDLLASFPVTATATLNGDEVVREVRIGALTVSKIRPDLDIITAENTVALAPGKSAAINVRLDRYNGVDCRIPLDVLNLPYGVRVMDTGLNGILVREGETERRIELYAEPWVQPIEKTIYVQAQIESDPRPSFVGPGIALQIGGPAEKVAKGD